MAQVLGFFSYIVEGIKSIRAWQRDRITLRARLSISADIELLNTVGCPCLIVLVTCTGTRPAKIRSAQISMKAPGIIDAFQKGFQDDLGYSPPHGTPCQNDSLSMGLVPLQRPNLPDGWRLERDDVCRFCLPILVPGVRLFARAKLRDPCITVTLLDETQIILLKGAIVRRTLASLFEAYGNLPCTLNPRVIVPIEVKVVSTTLPGGTSELIGRTNPAPVVLASQCESMLTEEQAEYLLKIAEPANEGRVYHALLDAFKGRETERYRDMLTGFVEDGLMRVESDSWVLTSRGYEKVDQLRKLHERKPTPPPLPKTDSS